MHFITEYLPQYFGNKFYLLTILERLMHEVLVIFHKILKPQFAPYFQKFPQTFYTLDNANTLQIIQNLLLRGVFNLLKTLCSMGNSH